jgi:hypothetical protein
MIYIHACGGSVPPLNSEVYVRMDVLDVEVERVDSSVAHLFVGEHYMQHLNKVSVSRHHPPLYVPTHILDQLVS